MKTNDAELQNGSGLFIGSEPIDEAQHRSAHGADKEDSGKDGLIGDTADDDSTDSGDTDGKDGNSSDESGDSDGKD